jgi:hypothetical protein
MPRPLKFPTKLLVGFDDDALKAIDMWRRKQDDLPNRSEAIRRLVAHSLHAETDSGRKPRAAKK